MPKKKDNRASEDLLARLHNAVGEDLLRKVSSGEATAQELQAAIKFLKDNGIEATLDGTSKPEQIAQHLPNFGDDDLATDAAIN